ncbi:hypothetical protein O0L34_g17287 [Tuta absoluta]|nr:hypothetical protein O0L34_g17287 [Tuta absoluta]
MSNHGYHGPPYPPPPPGGPPPYNQPYPQHLHPPPPTGGFAYVPAVMPMPMPYPAYPPPPEPQPQPTYVTNYIYNTPEVAATPVNVVDGPSPVSQPIQDGIDWIPATTSNASQLAHRAVVAGQEPGWNSSPIWVIRAHHSGNLVPGKLAINDRGAYIPFDGKEIPVHNFEVLSAPPHAIRWVPASNGQIPAGAVVAGNTHNAEPLFVGRVKHRSSLTPGKVHPSHGCLYISFGGQEVSHKSYEVLCRTYG